VGTRWDVEARGLVRIRRRSCSGWDSNLGIVEGNLVAEWQTHLSTMVCCADFIEVLSSFKGKCDILDRH